MATDLELLGRLRDGDEQAFVTLVARYHGSLLRLARTYVANDAVAEEAVQDTWMGVVRGADGFEGRSSFKTWLFRILANRARSAGAREHRDLPLDDGHEPAVDPARFTAAGTWVTPVAPWELDADDRLTAAAWTSCIAEAMEGLPPRQREVVLLRDVESLSPAEVCQVLEVSEANQRVLLHRGRSRLRSALEAHLPEKGR